MADPGIGTAQDPQLKAYGAQALFGSGGQVKSGVPGAAGYLAAANLAKLAYGNALVRINQGRSDTLRSYGYTGNIDAKTGVLGGLKVDPNNPYGQYQDMLHSGAQASSQAYSAAVGRGIGVGGGLAGSMQADVGRSFGQASQALGTGLSSALFGLQDEQTQAKFNQNQALYVAQHQAVQEAIAARQFTVQQAATAAATQAAQSAASNWGL